VTTAVVYGLAVAEGLAPVPGAAPYEVLARQLPRLLVARLNREGDRGVRFLPFLGNVGGRRCFLRVRDLLPPETLLAMHRQGAVDCIVDGRIHEAGLRLRILAGEAGLLRFESDLRFDPRAPLDVLPRAEFEVMTALGWQGPPAGTHALSGEALAWFLVARDALLALEAGLAAAGDFEPLRAARRCAELAPLDADVRRTVLELMAHVLRRDLDRTGAVALLTAFADACGDDEELLERIAGLLQGAGATQQACSVLIAVASKRPSRAAAVNAASAELFRQGRLAEAADLLRAAVAAGNGEPGVLARLAGIADLLGQDEERDRLCERILAAGDPPATVVRLLVAFLTEQDRMEQALALVERALQRDHADAALWLECARLQLLLGHTAAAQPGLARALTLDPDGESGRDARRLLRVAQVEGLMPALRRVEQSMREGRLREALAETLVLCRSAETCADVWLLAGILRQKLGQRRRAEHALRKALALEPALGDAHNRLGILLVARGRVEQGHAHLVQAQALLPAEPSVRLHLAQAAALLGRRAEGEQYIADAERLGAGAEEVAAIRRGFFTTDA
jgi:Tfp pilus assembly protein PilF